MTFATREEAGRKLGEYLAARGIRADAVLGLPRGGVIVAAEVAKVLRLPLDVVVVRKIGHPWHREFAVGALAEGDVVVLDEQAVGRGRSGRAGLEDVIAEERARLREYQARFRHAAPVERAGRDLILVDDGLATGATMEAAVRAVRQQGARRVIVAVPVASTLALERIGLLADDAVTMVADPNFDAVGRYYEKFPQTSDAEVLALLPAAANGRDLRGT